MTLYLQPYMDITRAVPTNSSDTVCVHSMFQLLYGRCYDIVVPKFLGKFLVGRY